MHLYKVLLLSFIQVRYVLLMSFVDSLFLLSVSVFTIINIFGLSFIAILYWYLIGYFSFGRNYSAYFLHKHFAELFILHFHYYFFLNWPLLHWSKFCKFNKLYVSKADVTPSLLAVIFYITREAIFQCYHKVWQWYLGLIKQVNQDCMMLKYMQRLLQCKEELVLLFQINNRLAAYFSAVSQMNYFALFSGVCKAFLVD